MTDILEGKHGVYNLDKREDCYAYLCREAGLIGQQLSMLERIYSTPVPAEVEDLLDHIISAANSVSIPSESNYLNELKSRLLAALSNTPPYLSRDVNVPVVELKDAAHRLAMYVLQSEAYQRDMDTRDAVDGVLALVMPKKAGE